MMNLPRAAAYAALLGLAVLLPFWVYPIFLMKILYMGLFAYALNLLLGYVGLLSFGHAAYFGCGAYLGAHALTQWGIGPVQALVISSVSAAVLGCGFGYLAIKRKGIYFSMITLALAQMFYFICLQAPFTFGEDGIQNVPRGTLLGFVDLDDTLNMYYFVLAICGLGVILLTRVVHSPLGNILVSIRENEARAISLGYNVNRYKLFAFTISSAAAGCAGGLKAMIFQLATLNDVGWHLSGEVVMMTVIGGIGTILGPLLGAAFIVSLESMLSGSKLPVTVVTGGVFILSVLLFKRGIVGEAMQLIRPRMPSKAP